MLESSGTSHLDSGFMLLNSLPLLGVLTAVLIMSGVQDWRSREVSNWITIPLFIAGWAACVWRLSTDLFGGVALIILMLILTAVALGGWMGGADRKVLVGLFGLWPLAGFVSLVVAGVWGLVEVIRTRDRCAHIPAVTAFALATVLTFVFQLGLKL